VWRLRTLSRPQRFVRFRNEKAFTLVETLFALSIFMLIVFFLTPIFQIFINNIVSNAKTQALEWDVFGSPFKKEVRASSNGQIISGKIFLTKDGDTIMYEKYGNNIRRRVNMTGHEIVLQNVADFTPELGSSSIKISVTDTWGNKYTMRAFSLLTWSTVP
jgi:competence protein ComGF